MRNKKFSSIVAIFAAAIAVFSATNFAQANSAPHIIINEIQTSGVTSNDDFVEIFNPTTASIVLDGYKLSKKTKSGSESTLLSSATGTKFLGTIPAHGYFLVAHPDYKGSLPADLAYSSSSSISSDNTLLLYDKSGTLLDKVGFGAAIDSEGSPTPNPSSNQSIARSGFADTDNNAADFSINTSPTPRNSTIVETDNEDGSDDDGEISDPAEEASTEASIEVSTGVSSASDDKTDAPEKTYSKNLKITELLPNPSADEDSGEFTELFNADSEEAVDLSGWKLEDKTGNSFSLPSVSIEPGAYRAFYRNKSSFSLNNTGGETVFLKNPGGEIVDQISYSGTVKEDFSYALSDKEFLWTSTLTPGEKNVFDAPEAAEKNTTKTSSPPEATENYTSGASIYLNEIMPNPKDGSDGEYIEIMNGGNEPADLIGWRIKDASKGKGYQFKEHTIISPGEYLAIYRPDSKIALNNSDESAYLYDPNGKIASSVSFAKSIKNSSYNFDGKIWKWSKYLTPNKKNKFDSEPVVKINKPKHAYKDLFTEFSASAKDKETKKLRYAWDFGDGKKSTLAKTTHKYLATGKYTVMLSVSDDSQTVEKSFTLEVKKYPRPDLEMVKIVPNPAGSDAEAETIDLKNNAGRKIDLMGWKIATGSGDKIFNHPISGEFVLNSNETKTITREFSKFSLNNKAGKVQLVMPDGKVIDEIEYLKDKIAEDEAYAKIDGEWKWLTPGAKDEIADESDTTEENIAADDENNDENADNGEVLGAKDENTSFSPDYYSRFTSEDAYIFLSRIYFSNPSAPENYCPANNSSSSIAYLLASLI